MKLHRNQVWLIPLLLILTYPLWSIPVGKFLTPRGGVPTQTVTRKTNQHNFRMESVKILQNQNGKKTALIRAKSARTGNDTDILILETVDADIFDEDGNVTHIVSRTGKYNVKTKALTLSGDVVVNKTRDKQFLYTDLLHYDSDKRTVNCPGKTKLIGENVSIDGGSLDYDINSSRYDIGGRVSVDLDGFSAPPPSPRS
ncbi:LPS export ABC transporter periplasmic protein LptC [Desulfomarina sp.]